MHAMEITHTYINKVHLVLEYKTTHALIFEINFNFISFQNMHFSLISACTLMRRNTVSVFYKYMY